MKRLTYEKIDLGAYVVTYKDQIVGELLCGDDGAWNYTPYDYWPPKRSGGAPEPLPSWVLSEISEKMDEMNDSWRKQLDLFFCNVIQTGDETQCQ